MRFVVLPSDRVFVVCSKKSGVPLSVFATEEAADADVGMVQDGRYVLPWVLRAATVVEVPS